METKILDFIRQIPFRVPLRGQVSRALSCAQLQMTRSVIEEIHKTIGSRPAEYGGILGGSREDGVVRYFYFDELAERSRGRYSPDVGTVNKVLSKDWDAAGINLLGFAHSHPPGMSHPSGGDIEYARKILAKIPGLKRLYLPIVMTEPDTGHFELFAYAAVRDGDGIRLEEMELALVDGEEVRTTGDLSETFRRVRSAYDLGQLAHCRLIYIGTGGAASFIEDMARAGVGEHVLIDPDIVSETNIATQQVYRKDIGRPKVDCIADRVKDINPASRVIARKRLLDDISDAEFKELALDPISVEAPWVTLICGLTDSFEAQSRVNRLALHFGLPSLCAQVYKEGRAGEITFTYPGVTPACHRCALSSRYKAYLENGFQNDVASDGTPIFATTRLNALKGCIAMAILHHTTNHPRWGRLLEKIGNRSLIQIRMDPDLESILGLSVFSKVFSSADQERILFDDVVWLPQKPDCPENGYPHCPDCGGTGDLRNVIGSFDTKKMRKEGSHAPVY